ncbi:MAG: SDR family oxidoreductase [Capsulimonas sp.]|uniref:SDR family oxidoreductase n=1 Tax=Capsulimonas sp. TaxID=2494211 RepID=UPI003267E44B
MSEKDLSGKVIVVTGASSGFGRGASVQFAKAGASVVLAARRGQVLDDVARECEAGGGLALAVPTDVSKSEEVEALAAATLARFGRIDVWVNNAGAGALGRFEDVPLADHVKVIETDLLGTLYGSYQAMRQFRQQQSGVLINIASVIGKVPAPYFSSYAAAKHGVVGLSSAIRQELNVNDVKNIHVCTVMPTSMDTPFFEHAANYTGHKAVPIPPTYDPQEVIDVILRLALKPEDEVVVGTAGVASAIGHNLAPHMTEAMMAKQTHAAQIEKAPPAEDTDGSVLEPMLSGVGVTGGVR